ncbi:MAG: cell division protein FtsA [Aerococcus sp.]|nr:cell division protein FtsA [Aerococcus sp.]MDO4680377.1 cell division protein FtsA [Aerococcus sp.]
MSQPKTFVGLDIGTTSVKVVVAEYANRRLNVIGMGIERSKGLSRGVITDIDQTVESIKSAVQQAEQKANVKIDNVVVGVPSNQISIEPCYGMVAVSSDNREVTDKDVHNVLSAAKVRAIPPEREIISVIPEEFVVDGFDGIRDPRGMVGVRLELYASMITGPTTVVHNIQLCVKRAGLKVQDMVVQPLANAYAAMSNDEREVGTILIDMGGGQTTASVMHDHQLKFSYVDQEGGEYVTKDISTVLNTSVENAERLKREYGYAQAESASPTEYFPVETIGKKEAGRSNEHYLSEIIEARLQQTFETLKTPLDQVEAFDLPGGVIITGGGSALPGVLGLAEDIFGHEATLYMSDQVGLRNPAFTTAYGLVLYAYQLPDIYHVSQVTGNNEPAKPKSTTTNSSLFMNQATSENDTPRPASTVSTPETNDRGFNDEAMESHDDYHYNEDNDYEMDDELDGESESIIDRIKDMFSDMFS